MPANPLAAVHAELGAFLVERAGTRVPARFGDAAAEHAAVRRTAGVFDLHSAGKIVVSGAERVRFLHSLVAADVASLAPGRGTYSLLLTREGRIASDLRIAVLEDRIIVLTPSISRGKVLRTFERHRVATDVAIEDATESRALLSVQGHLAPRIVEWTLGAAVPPLAPWGAADLPTQLGRVIVIRSPRTGEDGLDLLVPASGAPQIFRHLVDEVRAAGGLPCGLDALDSLRIETGRPSYGTEIDETTGLADLPEIAHGFGRAKGCFLGRETAERRIAEGRPEHRLAGLVFKSVMPPVRGDKLRAGSRAVGRITSACVSPAVGRPVALALVEPDLARPGGELETADGDRASVAQLPFVVPKLA